MRCNEIAKSLKLLSKSIYIHAERCASSFVIILFLCFSISYARDGYLILNFDMLCD